MTEFEDNKTLDKKEYHKEQIIAEHFLTEIKKLTNDLKALQTEELNRYKSIILKDMHEIRQWCC